MSYRSRRPHAALALFLILAIPGTVVAHQGASGVVKDRMEAMKDIAANMKSLGAMLKGQTRYNAQEAEKAAQAISDHAASFSALFPEGTNQKPSEALAEIWTDWEAFLALSEDLRKSASTLSLASTGTEISDDFKGAFSGVAKTCKGCHEKFRLKKQ